MLRIREHVLRNAIAMAAQSSCQARLLAYEGSGLVTVTCKLAGHVSSLALSRNQPVSP